MSLNGWRGKVAVAVISLVSLLLILQAGAEVEAAGSAVPVDVVPLRHLLGLVHQVYPGRVLGVELEQEEEGIGAGVWIYEVKMLTRRGRVYELKYDARTLELLGAEGVPD
jgi:uncharacterized membrane protein YkoI